MSGGTYVFHLAAHGKVMGAVEDLDSSFETNLLGTYSVFKVVRMAGSQRPVQLLP
jgi:nucleoside-diphosphate-sugar epimerase